LAQITQLLRGWRNANAFLAPAIAGQLRG